MEDPLDINNISFRRAKLKDCKEIWLWRNDKAVRKVSFSSDPIPFLHHRKWYQDRLQSKDSIFLKILWKNQDVGVLRFDFEGQSAEIHITIAPEKRNKGIGPASIKAGSEYLFKHEKIEFITAHIMANNTHSIRAFEKAGFIVTRKMKFKESNTIEMAYYRNLKAFDKFYPTKIGAIVQARMGSKRLPNKSMMEVGGEPIIKHIINNLKSSKYLSKVILATTDQKKDSILLELAKKLGVSGFSGSENDVLSRYNDAAEVFRLDAVVRVTGDNILTDIEGMDQTIALYLKEKPDMAINGGELGYPLGTAVEIFSANLLRNLNKIARSLDEKEHVTLHIYKHREKYHISYLEAPAGYRDLNVRLTIDSKDDLSFIRLLYKNLKGLKRDFKLQFIAEHIRKYPELKKINSHVKQKCFGV